jgi:hypothetical protein
MEEEVVSETSDFYYVSTRPVAREDIFNTAASETLDFTHVLPCIPREAIIW